MGGIGVDAHRFEAVLHPLVVELLGAELLERIVGRRTCQARVPAVEGHERHGAVEDVYKRQGLRLQRALLVELPVRIAGHSRAASVAQLLPAAAVLYLSLIHI